MSRWPSWHNPYFDPFSQSYVTGWPKPSTVIRSSGKKMTDKEAAVQAAIKSEAVQAWLCGQAIQWKLKSQTCWKDLDPGSTPDFTALTTEWRPSPIKDPEIKWFRLSDVEPAISQNCLVSDGSNVRYDRWVRSDPKDSWKRRSRQTYVYWSPLPKPAQVKK